MKKNTIIYEKERIQEEFEYEYLFRDAEVLEIPADLILYRILKINGFKSVVTEEDVQKYTKSLVVSYHRNKGNLPESLALNYPHFENYNTDLFEEVPLKNRKMGITLKKVRGKVEKELQEYRLARLDILFREYGSYFNKIVLFAEEQYKLKTKAMETVKKQGKKGNIRPLQFIKKKYFKYINKIIYFFLKFLL